MMYWFKQIIEALNMRLGSGTALIACALLAHACGAGEKTERDRSQTQQASDAVAANSTSSDTLDENSKASLSQLKHLFKDNADFRPEDLRSGFIACAGLEKLESSTEATISWKSSMRDYLATELYKFPNHNLLLSSVSGIYLTTSENLQYSKGKKKGRVGGITCQNSATSKSVIFLNEEEFVSSPKMNIQIGRWYETQNLVHNSVVEHHGDQTLYTLIHELFHAIDLVHFISGNDPKKRSERQAITDLSWNSITSPKFDRIAATALRLKSEASTASNELSPAVIKSLFTFSIHQPTEEAWSLAEDLSPKNIATEAQRQVKDYKALVNETNFLTPYSSSNAIEDFADTLASYYFGTRYNSWMIRNIYDLDLTKAPISESKLLFTFDTGGIIRQSEKHKSKACRMALLVFSEKCEPYLLPPKRPDENP